ncbi:metallophosphoesterase [Nocardia fluminea]|uniref:metallophosphoesterase n=1 Tax=Nocardia fluminea TaxID=134984 RepID=UPI00365DC465
MKTFYTSDLHIGHAWAAETRGYPSTESQDADLARRWDRTVGAKDQVWVLGDISIGGKKNELAALNWLSARNGTKHLVTGNHDGCHPMRSRAAKWQAEYLLHAFSSVQQTAVHKITGHRVWLSHFPFRHDPNGDHTEENRFEEWRVPDTGQWLIHGHTHAETRVRGRQLHVGVDAHHFTPVPQTWIADQIHHAGFDKPIESSL